MPPAQTDAQHRFDFAASGRRVFEIEQDALAAVAARIDGAFTAACQAILAGRGRVVCTGMGKSGHVARKIAATLGELMGGAIHALQLKTVTPDEVAS